MVFPTSLIKEKEKNVYSKYIENLQTSLYWCDLELSDLKNKKTRFSFKRTRKSRRKSPRKSPRKSRRKSLRKSHNKLKFK